MEMTPEERTNELVEACTRNPANYREFVLSLTSKPETYNLSDGVLNGLVEALHRLTPASLELDHFKRAMTYGEKLRINPPQHSCELAEVVENAQTRLRAVHVQLSQEESSRLLLIHALLGKITEAMELVPVLIGLITTDWVDRTNLIEELGDDAFYTALAEHAMEIDTSEVVQRNVMKLASRYKGGTFTREEAVNRDLGAERVALGDDGKGNDALGEDQ